MSSSGSKLGRNPFHQKAKPAAKSIMAEAPNPTEAAPAPEPGSQNYVSSEIASGKTLGREAGSALAKFALVDVPAATVVLGLKCILLATDVFSSKRK